MADKLKEALGNGDLLRLFMNAQKNLIAIVSKYDASNLYASYRSQQIKAIDVILTQLKLDVKDFTEEHVPAVVNDGASDVKDKINTFGENQFDFQFAGVPMGAVKILTEGAFLDFGKTIVGMRQDGMKAIINKRLLQEKIIEGVIQGSSIARTQGELIRILRDQGLTALKTKNGFGRNIKVEAYTNMLVRTQMMTAYNLGARTQMLNAGRMFGIFPTIPALNRSKDDPCWAWEEKKYVNLLKDPLPPASTHPNCRHKIQPVSMEQLKAERPDLYDEAIAYFNKTAG